MKPYKSIRHHLTPLTFLGRSLSVSLRISSGLSWSFILRFSLWVVAVSVFLPVDVNYTSYAQSGNVLLDEQKQEADVPKDLKPTDVIFWNARSAVYYQDSYVSLPVTLTTKLSFSLYEDQVQFFPPKDFEIIDIKRPPTSSLFDPVTRKNVNVYTGGDFELILKANNSPGSENLTFSVRYLGCTTKICLFPYTETITTKLVSSDKNYLAAEPALNNSIDSIAPRIELAEPVVGASSGWQTELASIFKSEKTSLALILLVVFIGGILTNLTPCVYPMIPITLRVLAGQSKRPFLGSSMYGLGILITYTALGLFAVLTGSLFGSIMASKGFNFTLGAIMVLMAFSMLGFGNFSRLQQIGAKLGSGKASAKNAFLMGTGAGLVASPCTGPVLASILSYTAVKGNYVEATVLLTIYSLGFALPYVILGGAAAKVTSIKLSPKLQVTTKLLFASVIMALAFFYFRIPFYGLSQSLNSYWGDLSTSFMTLGVLMLTVVMVSKDIFNVKFFLVGPMLALGIGIFSISQYVSSASDQVKKIAWIKDEQIALDIARAENRPVLIDAWAEWCVACKKMDVTTFVDPTLLRKLEEKKFVMLKLDLTESTDESDLLQSKYRIQGLPTIIFLKSGGDLETMEVIGGLQSANDLLKVMANY